MDNLWAPWRIDYILSKKPPGCIFCDKPAEDRDTENYILYRGKYHFIILNAFPYNNGHMMVVPYRHTASLARLGGRRAAGDDAACRSVRRAAQDHHAPGRL